jgi:hypothetical protein
MTLKEYLPNPKTIPAIIILGGFGAAIVIKAFPKLAAWLSNITPVIQKTAATTPTTTP